MNKIPFTIKFPQTKYTRDEVYNFWTTTKETQVEGSFKDENQKERYVKFLDDFQNKICKCNNY